MPSLRELQTDFVAAIFSGDSDVAALLKHCAGEPPRARQGIAAYRASVSANLAHALQTSYPIVEAIVGTEFLAAATHAYALERPSRSGDLNAYGADFDAFLADYRPAASLPYLPAIARLEWQVVQVYSAADAPVQDLSLLAATPPERWGELRFRLDPAYAVLESSWPIYRIWEVNQIGYAGDFSVDFALPQAVVIQRRQMKVAVELSNRDEYAFIDRLARGETLEQAVEQAVARCADFDLSSTLQRLIASGVLRGAY
ncbi:MAG TPA: DNA-binding domain-containing protein [Rhodocyclaceae bacterium]|nr:DNA-binding domain-containing protein [Rhodocyclaceae bacterium]